VKTFSLGCDEPDFDELEHARRVAAYFGTDQHELVVKPEAIAILGKETASLRSEMRLRGLDELRPTSGGG